MKREAAKIAAEKEQRLHENKLAIIDAKAGVSSNKRDLVVNSSKISANTKIQVSSPPEAPELEYCLLVSITNGPTHMKHEPTCFVPIRLILDYQILKETAKVKL